jgi:hypothetical protein
VGDFLVFVGFLLFVVGGVGSLIQSASRSSPENIAKDAARFDQELRIAVGRTDRKRAEALLRALPKWPPRDSLLAATNSLMELREGTAHAKAVAVSPHFLENVHARASACEHAVCLVAVRMLAARLHSGQARFRSLSDRSRAALLDDAQEMDQITSSARAVHGSLTDMITDGPGRNGGWALGLVGRDLEALAIASANIVAKGELR